MTRGDLGPDSGNARRIGISTSGCRPAEGLKAEKLLFGEGRKRGKDPAGDQASGGRGRQRGRQRGPLENGGCSPVSSSGGVKTDLRKERGLRRETTSVALFFPCSTN